MRPKVIRTAFRLRDGRCVGRFYRSRPVQLDFMESGAGNNKPSISGTGTFVIRFPASVNRSTATDSRPNSKSALMSLILQL